MHDSKLHYLSVYVQKEKVKKQLQGQKPLSKGDKEGVTTHSQNDTHSSGQGPLGQPCHRWWESHVLTPHRLH